MLAGRNEKDVEVVLEGDCWAETNVENWERDSNHDCVDKDQLVEPRQYCRWMGWPRSSCCMSKDLLYYCCCHCLRVQVY